jgi:hypothetical protein
MQCIAVKCEMALEKPTIVANFCTLKQCCLDLLEPKTCWYLLWQINSRYSFLFDFIERMKK